MRFAVFGCVVLALGAASARADAREWESTHFDASMAQAVFVPTGPGSAVFAFPVREENGWSAWRAAVVRGGETGPVQGDLPGRAYWNMLGGDGSSVFGGVVAWVDDDGLHVGEAGPGDDALTVSEVIPATYGNYSYGGPDVAVGPSGDKAVVYLGWDYDTWQQRVMAVLKPAGGAWGEPEPVGPLREPDQTFGRSVAIGPDGTVAVGLVVDGRARVATRPPGGAFTVSEPLGAELPEHSWLTPLVGVDGAGTVVAAWLEGAALNDVGPVEVAFRRPGADAFEAPVDSGLAATDLGRIRLGVSAPGEVVLVVEASSRGVPGEYTHIEGIQAVFGNTLLGRLGPPAALSDSIWGSYPSFDMNARGDAFVVWDECCPMTLKGRRRAPLASFQPQEDVAPPIEFEGSRFGRFALDADVDDFGNARASWVDGEPDPEQVFAGWDSPARLDPLPDLPPLGELIPAVVPPLPDPPVVAEPPAGPDAEATPSPSPSPGPLAVRPPTPLDSARSPTAPAVDRVPPAIAARGAHLRRHRLVVRLRSTEHANAWLQVRARRFAGRPVRTELAAGRSLRLSLPVGRRVTSAVRLVGIAADSAGNVAPVRTLVAVRRRR